MAISEQARKNHDKLFPGHVSTLAVTDPEFIETFDNFAFDEVLRHGNLDDRTRLMVQLASTIASQALREYRVMLGAALTVGVTPVESMRSTGEGACRREPQRRQRPRTAD
jgi:4-carboxymuconolactone decarboxylase